MGVGCDQLKRNNKLFAGGQWSGLSDVALMAIKKDCTALPHSAPDFQAAKQVPGHVNMPAPDEIRCPTERKWWVVRCL